jgi:hypothetical protein
METVADFVQRTEGPVVPYVPDWYPWVYAHHYLRLEVAHLPAEFRRVAAPSAGAISISEARELIYLWCGLSGEGIQPAVRMLADAYLRRWGIERGSPRERPVTPAPPVPGRRWRRQQWPVGRIPGQRGRTRRALAVVAPGARSA